ncbi:MAG: hypothetical protein K6T83_07890 [Alicyclobacillus sp.]|nr:hypothetical protein [Alicyclobacillus sp.]
MKDDIEVQDAYATDLPPLELPAEDNPDTQPEADEQPPIVTTNQVATFLRLTYQVHGLATRLPEIWQHDEAWYERIAEGITPHVQALCARMPAMGLAIRALDAAGTWGELFWDYALCWVRTLATRKTAEQEVHAGGHAEPAKPSNPYVIDYGT